MYKNRPYFENSGPNWSKLQWQFDQVTDIITYDLLYFWKIENSGGGGVPFQLPFPVCPAMFQALH